MKSHPEVPLKLIDVFEECRVLAESWQLGKGNPPNELDLRRLGRLSVQVGVILFRWGRYKIVVLHCNIIHSVHYFSGQQRLMRGL